MIDLNTAKEMSLHQLTEVVHENEEYLTKHNYEELKQRAEQLEIFRKALAIVKKSGPQQIWSTVGCPGAVRYKVHIMKTKRLAREAAEAAKKKQRE